MLVEEEDSHRITVPVVSGKKLDDPLIQSLSRLDFNLQGF